MAITNELEELLHQLGELAALAQDLGTIGSLKRVKAEAAAAIDAARREVEQIKAEAGRVKAQAEQAKAEAIDAIQRANNHAEDIRQGANAEYEAIVANAKLKAGRIMADLEAERQVAVGKLAALNALVREKQQAAQAIGANTHRAACNTSRNEQ